MSAAILAWSQRRDSLKICDFRYIGQFYCALIT